MSVIVSCEVCGNFYEARNRKSRYCGEKCRSEAANERAKMRYRKEKAYKSRISSPKGDKTLEEWVAEASAAGKSYGQYRAMIEMQERREGVNDYDFK